MTYDVSLLATVLSPPTPSTVAWCTMSVVGPEAPSQVILNGVPALRLSNVGYVKCRSGVEAALLEEIPALSAANDGCGNGRAVDFPVAKTNRRHEWSSTLSHEHDFILQSSFRIQLFTSVKFSTSPFVHKGRRMRSIYHQLRSTELAVRFAVLGAWLDKNSRGEEFQGEIRRGQDATAQHRYGPIGKRSENKHWHSVGISVACRVTASPGHLGIGPSLISR